MRPKDISITAVIIILWSVIGYFVYATYFKKEQKVEPITTETSSLESINFNEANKEKINQKEANGEFPLKVDPGVKNNQDPFK